MDRILWIIAEDLQQRGGIDLYDSDQLDAELRKRRIRFIAQHNLNRRKKRTKDGRELRRYTCRWKIERLFAWLQTFRRSATRWEYKSSNYFGFFNSGVSLFCSGIIFEITFN